MNYLRIYKNIISKARNEKRVKYKGEYFEKHHIVPNFMFKDRRGRSGVKGHLDGNPDEPNNIVLLTAREHFLCHLLLVKILDGKQYWASAKTSLVFFYTNGISQHARDSIDGKFNSVKYERYRKLAISGLSESNKGKMIVKDKDTNEIVGKYPIDHPMILSGQWVHHSKGVKQSSETKKRQSIAMTGSGNTNFKEMTPERKKRLFDCVPHATVDNVLYLNMLIERMQIVFTEWKSVSHVWIKNNFGNVENFLAEYNKETKMNIQYKKYGKCRVK